MLGSVPDFARSSGYPPTAALSINSVIDATANTRSWSAKPYAAVCAHATKALIDADFGWLLRCTI